MADGEEMLQTHTAPSSYTRRLRVADIHRNEEHASNLLRTSAGLKLSLPTVKPCRNDPCNSPVMKSQCQGPQEYSIHDHKNHCHKNSHGVIRREFHPCEDLDMDLDMDMDMEGWRMPGTDTDLGSWKWKLTLHSM